MAVRRRSRMKKKSAPILVIAHNLFLSRAERYQLIECEPIEVVGASLPVWFSLKHTSEPAEEIFCKYSIHNNKNEPGGTVQRIAGGYRINLPQLPKDWAPSAPLTDEEWRLMGEKELTAWYKNHGTPANANYLRDIKDGGGEHLKFRYLGEATENEKSLQLIHYCQLKTIESLCNSFV